MLTKPLISKKKLNLTEDGLSPTLIKKVRSLRFLHVIFLLATLLLTVNYAKSQCSTDWLKTIQPISVGGSQPTGPNGLVVLNQLGETYLLFEFKNPLNQMYQYYHELNFEVTLTSSIYSTSKIITCVREDDHAYNHYIYRIFNLNTGALNPIDEGTISIRLIFPEERREAYSWKGEGWFDEQVSWLNAQFCSISFNYAVSPSPLEGGTLLYLPEVIGNRSDINEPIGTMPAAGGVGSYSYQWEIKGSDNSWAPIDNATKQLFYIVKEGTYRRKVTDDASNTAYTNELTFRYRNSIWPFGCRIEWYYEDDPSNIYVDQPIEFDGIENREIFVKFYLDSQAYISNYQYFSYNYIIEKLDEDGVLRQYNYTNFVDNDYRITSYNLEDIEGYAWGKSFRINTSYLGDDPFQGKFILYCTKDDQYFDIEIPFTQSVLSFPIPCKTRWLENIKQPQFSNSIVSPGGTIMLNPSGENTWLPKISEEWINGFGWYKSSYTLEVVRTSYLTGVIDTIQCGNTAWHSDYGFEFIDGHIFFNTGPLSIDDYGRLDFYLYIPESSRTGHGLQGDVKYKYYNSLICSESFDYNVSGVNPLYGGFIPPTTLGCHSVAHYSTLYIGQEEATGGNQPYAYQWQELVEGGSWKDIARAVQQTYTPTKDGAYRRKVTDDIGNIAYTNEYSFSWCPGTWTASFYWQVENENPIPQFSKAISFAPEGQDNITIGAYASCDFNPGVIYQFLGYKVMLKQADGGYVEQTDDNIKVTYLGLHPSDNWYDTSEIDKFNVSINENCNAQPIEGKILIAYAGSCDWTLYTLADIPFSQESAFKCKQPWLNSITPANSSNSISPEEVVTLNLSGENLWQFETKPITDVNLFNSVYELEISKVNPVTGQTEKVPCNAKPWVDGYITLNTSSFAAGETGQLYFKAYIPEKYKEQLGLSNCEFSKLSSYYCDAIFTYSVPIPENLPLEGGIIQPKACQSYFITPSSIGYIPALGGEKPYSYQWEFRPLHLSTWTNLAGETNQLHKPMVEGVYRRKVTDANNDIAYTNEYSLTYCTQGWEQGHGYSWRINENGQPTYHNTAITFRPEGNEDVQLEIVLNKPTPSSDVYRPKLVDYRVLIQRPDGTYRMQIDDRFLPFSAEELTDDRWGDVLHLLANENSLGETLAGELVLSYVIDNGKQYVVKVPFSQETLTEEKLLRAPTIITRVSAYPYGESVYLGQQAGQIRLSKPIIGGFKNILQWENRAIEPEVAEWQAVPTNLPSGESGCIPSTKDVVSKYEYRLKVTSFYGQVVYSNSVTIIWRDYMLESEPGRKLTVGNAYPTQVIPEPSLQPEMLFCNSPAAGGKSENYVYMWQSSDHELYGFKDIPGTSSTVLQGYQPSRPTDNKYFRLKVTCEDEEAYSEHSAGIIVNPPLLGGYISHIEVLKPGENPNIIQNRTSASGGYCTISYIWKYAYLPDPKFDWSNGRYKDLDWVEIAGTEGMLEYQPEPSDVSRLFQRKASCSNGAVAYSNFCILQIVEELDPYPGISDSYDISTSYAVGEIPISTDVSATGSLTFNVPIDVMPGLNGLQPNISLGYNSSSGNGVLGVGWNLSGLSSIIRKKSTIYYEGAVAPIDLTPYKEQSASFSLDGTHLVKISTGANSITYETEVGNTRVTSYITNGITTHFKVLYPNGMVGTFGYEGYADSYLSYPITKLEDTNGNYITFTYDFRNNHYYITKIEYGGSESTEHFASVIFRYKKRIDTMSGYTAGIKMEEDYLLYVITCYSEMHPIRKYTLTYNEEVEVETSLLVKIDCEVDGVNLNPLIFDHGLVGYLKAFDTEEISFANKGYHSSSYVQMGKTNSNNDIFVLTYSEKESYVNLQQKSTMFSHSKNYLYNRYADNPDAKLYIHYNLHKGETSRMDSLALGTDFIKAFIVNVDKDVDDELVKINNKVVNNKDIVTIQVYRLDPESGVYLYKEKEFDFGEAIVDHSKNRSVHPKYYFVGDFDGDGVGDILVLSRQELRENPPVNFYFINLVNDKLTYLSHDLDINLERRNDKWDKYKEKYNYYPGGNDQFLFLDYDGDGKTDIGFLKPEKFYIYSYQPNRYSGTGSLVRKDAFDISTDLQQRSDRNIALIGDINSDGNTDIICYIEATEDSEAYLEVHYSKGKNGFETVKMPFEGGPKEFESNYFALQDVNRDGYLDIITRNGIYLNKNGIIDDYCTVDKYIGGTIVAGEVGMKAQSNAQFLSISGYGLVKYDYLQDDGIQNQISGTVNSFGVVTKVWNRRLNEDRNYHSIDSENPVTFPYEVFNGPLSVVKKMENYWKGNLLDSLTYAYDHAVIHKQGLGFLGFRKFHATNGLKDVTTTRTFDPVQYGIPVEDFTDGIGRTTYSYDIERNRTLKILMKSKITEDYIKGVTTSFRYEHDYYGNVTKEEATFSDGETLTGTTTYINKRTATENVLGLPSVQEQTRTNGEGSWSTRTEVEYDDNNRPKVSKELVQGNQVSETKFTYNNFGTVSSERSKAYSSPNSHETTYEYSHNGRFLIKQTDPMGLETTYTYNESKALLESETDYLGNTTSYDTYDAFRRLLFTSNPDGTTASTSYEWVEDDADMLYKITQTATQSSSSSIYYDALNREVRKSHQGFDGTMVNVDSKYDKFGRLYKTSNPYKADAAPMGWSESYFMSDTDDRISSVTDPTGKIITYSYSGYDLTIEDDWTTTRSYNSQGELVQVHESAGAISNDIVYSLRADGQPASITAPDGAVTSFEYDEYGRQTQITDPSAGTLTYTYDADGNRNSITNARGQLLTTTFNEFGLPKERHTPEMTTTYTYDTEDKKDYSLLSVVSSNGTSQSFVYDSFGRTISETETVGSETMTTDYVYQKDKLVSVEYSKLSGRPLTYTYNDYGYVEKVDLSGGPTIWTLEQANEFGQPESVLLGNGLRNQFAYTANGFPLQQKVAGSGEPVQFFSYSFNEANKLLNSRENLVSGTREDFTYDDLSRLTSDGAVDITFDDMGSPIYKTDAGMLDYDDTDKPYAIKQQEFELTESTMRVRYIRDWLNGSQMNGYCHWVEVQAIQEQLVDGQLVLANVALGKPVTGDATDLERVTDGNTDSNFHTDYSYGLKSVTVDLEEVYDISSVRVWHYYKDGRTYYGGKTEVSEDGVNWVTLYDYTVDGAYAETEAGRSYNAPSVTPPVTKPIRYIRDWLNGNSVNGIWNHWGEIQAIHTYQKDGAFIFTNVAKGKPVFGECTDIGKVTDGNTNSDNHTDYSSGLKSVTVDLGEVYNISEVKVWHYYADRRTYHGNKTEVSADGVSWTVLHDAETDGEYVETPTGRTYSFYPATPLREQQITFASFERPLSIEENGYKANFVYNASGTRKQMNLTYNSAAELSRYYIGSSYEKEVLANGKVVERLYLNGSPYSAPAVWVKEDGAEQLLYIHRDHLGSITALSDADGEKVAEYSYDAWGRMRNPQTLVQYGPDAQPTLMLGRGYTGHEHLPWFGLINMNARLYDPVLGRFVTPDPYVQMLDFSQSFNRYSYAINNPLAYVDQNGKFFFGILNAVKDFFVNTFGKVWSQGFNAWSDSDNWKSTANAFKIDWGLFQGSPRQILSRFTWESLQTTIGYTYSHIRNTGYAVDEVKYYDGATYVINASSKNYNGVTIGSFINMNIREPYEKSKFEPDGKFAPYYDNMFMHEYGHYIQSQKSGFNYLFKYGLPSLIARGKYKDDKVSIEVNGWTYEYGLADIVKPEIDANKEAYNYFKNKLNGKEKEKAAYYLNTWRFIKYPIVYPGNSSSFTYQKR